MIGETAFDHGTAHRSTRNGGDRVRFKTLKMEPQPIPGGLITPEALATDRTQAAPPNQLHAESVRLHRERNGSCPGERLRQQMF